MKTKKDVIGVVGIVLLIMAAAAMGDYGSLVSSEKADEIPYDEIVADIDDSLIKTYSNNDKIRSLSEDLEMRRDILRNALDNYTSLGEEIKMINNDIGKLEKEINETKIDSDKLKEKRVRLQNQIEGDSEETEKKNGIRAWFFYASLFISVNLFIWFEISTYYKERNFRY